MIMIMRMININKCLIIKCTLLQNQHNLQIIILPTPHSLIKVVAINQLLWTNSINLNIQTIIIIHKKNINIVKNIDNQKNLIKDL